MMKFTTILFGCGVIVALIICKLFNSPTIFLLIIILASIGYQFLGSRNHSRSINLDEMLINMSQFIIVSGIIGYIVVRVLSYFYRGFN